MHLTNTRVCYKREVNADTNRFTHAYVHMCEHFPRRVYSRAVVDLELHVPPRFHDRCL